MTRATRRKEMGSLGYRRTESRSGRRPGIRAPRAATEPSYPGLRQAGFVVLEAVEEGGVRCYVESKERPASWSPGVERRISRQVITYLAGPALDGGFGVGAWAIGDRDAQSQVVRSGLVLPDDCSDDELSHRPGAHRRREFVDRTLLPMAWERQIPLAGFDQSRTLGLTSVDWTPTKRGDGLSLVLDTTAASDLPAAKRRRLVRLSRGGYEKPWIPRILLAALDGERSFASFARTVDQGKGGPGVFIDLRTIAHVHGLPTGSIFELAESLSLCIRPSDGTEVFLAEAELLVRIYWRLLARHESIVGRTWGMDQIQSGGSYAKALFERIGLVPPLVRWPNFPKWVLGASAEAFFGGEYHLEHRGELVSNVVPFDVQSEYGLGVVLTHAYRVLASRKLRIEPVDPTEVTEQLRRLTLADAIDPKLYAKLGFTFARFVARGQVLPSRPEVDGEWPLRVAPTWCPEPAWHHALTLVRVVLDPTSGPLEDGQIVEAFRIVPEGRQRELRAIDLPGLGRFEPTSRNADLFAFLGSGRARLQAGGTRSDLGPWSTKDLARFLKGVIPMAAFGIFAEVRPRRVRGRPERVTVWAGERTPRTAHMRIVEEPGPWQFWPIASAVTAAGRLLFHVVSLLVAEEGGRRVYGDTDSCIAAGLDPEAALRVQARFDRLNPYGIGGPRITIGGDGRFRLYPDRHDGALLLRIQPEAWADEPRIDERGERYFEQVPLAFLGWHSKRYMLPGPDDQARMYSEAGLGALLDPRGGDPSAPTDWIAEALEHVAGTGPEPPWADAWQLAVVPANSPEVSRLFEGKVSKRLALRPWEPVVLAYEDVLVGKGRVLAAPYRPGFDPTRAPWRVFGTGDRVKAKPARPRDYELDPERPEHIEVRTMRGELQRYPLVTERGTIGPDQKPCRRGTVGFLQARPVTISRLRRIGKESHGIEEALAGQRQALTVYPAERRGSRSPADQAFRDALKVLNRERDAGRDIDVRDSRNRRIPAHIVDVALSSRTAPGKIRAAIVRAADLLTRTGTSPSLVVSRCEWCGLPLPQGRTRWCSANTCRKRASRARAKLAAS